MIAGRFALVLFFVIACSPAPGVLSQASKRPLEAAVRKGMYVSFSPDRSGAQLLDGYVSLNGAAYVFADGIMNVHHVDVYRVDDPAAFRRVEQTPPWDYAGTTPELLAAPYDFSRFEPGFHSLSSVVTYLDGSTETLTGYFRRDTLTDLPPWRNDLCPRPNEAAIEGDSIIVGDGTAASCTDAAFQTAVEKAGNIRFACGDLPVTLTLSATARIQQDTAVDGGGLVTLDGAHSTRLFRIDGDETSASPRLVLRGLVLRAGQPRAPANPAEPVREDFGGVVFRRGGSLSIYDSEITDNHAPMSVRSTWAVGGGAITAIGGGLTRIVNTRLHHNSSGLGGAIASFDAPLDIINSELNRNSVQDPALPDDAGVRFGGAVSTRGARRMRVCGSSFEGNLAAQGGAIYRSTASRDSVLIIEQSQFVNNYALADWLSSGGALALDAGDFTLDGSLVAGNLSLAAGAFTQGRGSIRIVNSTIVNNISSRPQYGNVALGDELEGSIRNSTFAFNSSPTGYLFGYGRSPRRGGIVLKNTLIQANLPLGLPGWRAYACSGAHFLDGGGVVQWPDNDACTSDTVFADTAMDPLAHNGGATLTSLPTRAAPELFTGVGCEPIDQRAVSRSEPCTIGAVELPH